MTKRTRISLLLMPLLLAALGLSYWPASQTTTAPDSADTIVKVAQSDHVVFLGGGLGEEELLTFTTTLAASGHAGVVLLDSPTKGPNFKAFLAAFRPEQVIPVGSFPDGLPELERRLGMKTTPALRWKRGPPTGLWKALIPKAERAVLCPAQPRPLLLQAGCLAGALQAPLFVTHGDGEEEQIARQLKEWETKEIHVVGNTAKLDLNMPDLRRVPLEDVADVSKAYLQQLRKKGPIQNLVVANPADLTEEKGSLSTLAPWIALQRRAPLLLSNQAGSDVADLVSAALKNAGMREVDSLILVGNLKALPMNRRPNPAAGKDMEITMEPLTPRGEDTFTFATGRLFHEDRGAVLMMLARPRLFSAEHPQLKALVASNPGGHLPLLEVFSRNTAKEMRNGGFQTKALFNGEVNKDDLRRLLPEQNLFLWEGHYRTLMENYGFASWDEPLQPSLVFLQSCLALNEEESQPLLRRGALAVVGSSTRNYSASGGAFSLAFFDALLYDQQTLGGALRHAKNYLLCYSLLKEKRLGEDAKLGGANLRSAWAFTLWGDPTFKFPKVEMPADAITPIRHELKGDTIIVALPESAYDKVTSGRYQATMRPNARLAGLLRKDDEVSTLVPFIFVEVPLPKRPEGKTPTLTSKLSDKNWVFCWDKRRNVGYLLITPREKDTKELRFRVVWGE